MMEALRHRGPDGEGLLVDGPVALGHRRLSIIDIGGGAQPVFNEDRSVAVILNGEIYNYRELRDELRGRHQLKTASDTEVLVHLYEDRGVEMLGALRGMFAFVIWDAKKQQLFAARDRVGKKPLLYCENGDELFIASEIRALRAAGCQLGSIDPTALSGYLELLYVPAPRTIWSRVRKLAPGHYMVARNGSLETRRYWDMPRPGTILNVDPGIEARTLHTLEESTALRLRSDVPVGVLLSGGIDSAVVTRLASESESRLKTFTVGFGREDDELAAARQVAQRCGTEHHEIMVDDDVVGATQRALSAFSEPFGDSSAVPCSEVFRHVAREVRVVLTGDGGDEVFAGYGRYRRVERLPTLPLLRFAGQALERAQGVPPLRRASRLAAVVSSTGRQRARAVMAVFSPHERAAMLGVTSTDWGPGAGTANGNGNAAIEFDLDVYLPDDLLVKTDITSMAWSLEARCPLLDQELLQQVVPLPLSAKQDTQRGKLLLRHAVGSKLPAEVFARPKRGFGSPISEWLRGSLRPFFTDHLLSAGARVRQWLDGKTIERVASEALRGTGNAHQAWALLALEVWASNAASNEGRPRGNVQERPYGGE
jgi:asparagine synthase (glutamine-hydrolysing)